MRTSSCWRTATALVSSLLLAAVALSVPATAQASRERTLYVSAVNDDGEPVKDLGPDAFVVREDGVKREVLRVSPATDPIDIALVVDNSQAAARDVTFIREAVTKFIALMSSNNPIAIVGLAERPTILTDYTKDPARLAKGVGRLFGMPGAGMTLLDAVVEVTHGIEKREPPRAAIIAVITDGPEFTTRFSKDVTATVTRAHIPFYAVTLGMFPYSDVQDVRERIFFLDEGPHDSGGARDNILAPNGIEPSLLRFGRELKNQYAVVYSRPESLIPPRKIEVSSARDGITMRGAPARGQKED